MNDDYIMVNDSIVYSWFYRKKGVMLLLVELFMLQNRKHSYTIGVDLVDLANKIGLSYEELKNALNCLIRKKVITKERDHNHPKTSQRVIIKILDQDILTRDYLP